MVWHHGGGNLQSLWKHTHVALIKCFLYKKNASCFLHFCCVYFEVSTQHIWTYSFKCWPPNCIMTCWLYTIPYTLYCGCIFICYLPWLTTVCVLTCLSHCSVQAQRRSKEHSRSTSAMSGVGDEKSEVSENVDHHASLYSNGFGVSALHGTFKVLELSWHWYDLAW